MMVLIAALCLFRGAEWLSVLQQLLSRSMLILADT